jgi:hypothetical protein
MAAGCDAGHSQGLAFRAELRPMLLEQRLPLFAFASLDIPQTIENRPEWMSAPVCHHPCLRLP